MLPYEIAYADTDAGGIVYHARYVEMAERSRNHALKLLGFPVSQMKARFGVQFIIREVRITCHRPSVVGDTLALSSGIVAASSVRMIWRTLIGRNGEPVCDVEAQIAAFDPVLCGPCPLPADLVAHLHEVPRLPPVRTRPMMRTGPRA